MLKTSERLLSLLSMLQARRDWPGALLAERLDISPRTVRRDIDRLRELGYPIAAIKGPDGGYQLRAGAELPPLLFDDEQAVAVTVALQLAINNGGGIEEAAARALNSVRQVMPSRLRHRVDSISVTAVHRPSIRPEARVDAAVLTTLSAAVHAHEVLRFDYASPAEPDAAAGAPRRAEPHHLITWGNRWYLIAWDLEQDDWRMFRADRISPRIPNGPRFTPRELPGGDVSTYAAGVFRGSAAGTSRWPCEGEVIIDLTADEVAPFVSDGTVVPLSDDRCRVSEGSWSWVSLAAAFARFDANIEVVGPSDLRDAFAVLAQRFAQA